MMPHPSSSQPEARTLIVGSLLKSQRARSSYTLASGLSSSPTLHDFGILIARYSNESFRRTPAEKWKEWRDLLRSGGTAIILNMDPSVQRHSEKLMSKPFPGLIAQRGQRASWVRGTRFH